MKISKLAPVYRVLKFIIIFMLIIDLIHNSQYDNVVCFISLIIFLIILILVYCFLKKKDMI